MSAMTPDEIGAYDQAFAEADAEVDRLLSVLRTGASESGEHQAMAIVGYAVSQRDPDALTGLLMAALRRLNGEQR